ncbi:MAG: intradiol ring-cleavage dioxygenase [Chloroflexi bacterium]|nr:MAG: intradiol ring-cleavage dioxygenase [Chloroflexota bacterium]
MRPLTESVMSRRTVLLGTLGLWFGVMVAACTGRNPSALSSASASPSSSSSPIATPACVVTPAETEGPYFVDERLNRSDITTDPSNASVKSGVPLALTFSVARVGASGCTALSGAQVDVWHCDASGVYSDVSAQSTVGKRFLRGYQVTDAGGLAKFTTIYPGWYSGRAVHIHFKIRTFSGTSKTYEFTSQLFFDDATTDLVYKNASYSARPSRDTRNQADMVYTSNGNSGAMLLASLTPSGAGYAAAFAIGLNLG